MHPSSVDLLHLYFLLQAETIPNHNRDENGPISDAAADKKILTEVSVSHRFSFFIYFLFFEIFLLKRFVIHFGYRAV